MTRLRKASAYRKFERPYTRKSKYQEKSYVRAIPTNKIVRYVMGNSKKEFEHTLDMVSKEDVQLRHNGLESARLAVFRYLDRNLVKGNFYFRILVYPHHILRENPLASGAGADRMSTGMKRSFGKSVGLAARVKQGQPVFRVNVNKQDLAVAKKSLERARTKLPSKFAIQIT
ncbi:50S ribosomal protein L16 [Candidatus Woesearchaeota archaeon]|nr:50S ribosomal protein L16 [Candidatus Woesearchaeota archaeon]